MGGDKRAKKFRQKHLKNKIDSQKKSQKAIPKWKQNKPAKKSSSEPASNAESPNEGRNFDAAPIDVFEGNEEPNLDKYLSDSEEEEINDAEREYLEGEMPQFGDESKPTFESVKQLVSDLEKSANSLPKALNYAENFIFDQTIDEDVSNAVLLMFLEAVPKSVQNHIVDEQSRSKYGSMLKRIVALFVNFLNDAGTADPDFLLKLILAANQLIPALPSAKKEKQALLKQIVKIVSNTRIQDQIKLAAFDILRSLDDREKVAKQCYLSLVKMSARTNPRTVDSLNLCKNLYAFLFDERCYQLAFQQIRQLALHLKTALDKTKHPNYGTEVVYTNQFVQALDFWSRCVAQHSCLEPLVHPLCQVTLKTISLVPGAQFLPLKFFLTRSLVRLARTTGVYIPLAGPVLECVLHTTVLSKPGKPSSLEQFDFDSQLHAPAQFLNTKVYQTTVLQEFTDILAECLALYSKSIAFPELQAPVATKLRKFAKHEAASPEIKRVLIAFSDRLQANSEYILQRRRKVKFGPKNRNQVDKFLEDVNWETTPLGKETVARVKVRVERQKLAKQALETEREDEVENELELENESENEEEIEAALEME